LIRAFTLAWFIDIKPVSMPENMPEKCKRNTKMMSLIIATSSENRLLNIATGHDNTTLL